MMIAYTERCWWLVPFWAAVLWVMLLPSQALAQQSRVLVVAGKGVSADAQHAVSDAVEQVGELVEARGYLSVARARKLQPTSDTALRELAPRQRVSLIVVTRRQHGKLVLSYRDGKSGAVIGEDRFVMPRRGKKDPHLHGALTDGVRAALAGDAPPAVAQPSAADEAEEEASEDTSPPPFAAEQPSVVEERAEERPAVEQREPQASPESAARAESPERLRVSVAVGAGAAIRSSELPTRAGTRSLATGLHPGLALSVSAYGMLGSHFRLAAAADYRTSAGLSGLETPAPSEERTTSLRAHSLSLGLAPGYRFGAADSVVLQLHLGWMFQGLRPVVDLSFPAVSWHGAVLRPELIIPFGDGNVTLRIAPEVVAVAGIYTTLTGRTGLARAGLAFGAEIALDVRLASWLLLGFDYRESHMSLGTSWGADFTDVTRFGSARLILRY
jgi:hypothetical protein